MNIAITGQAQRDLISSVQLGSGIGAARFLRFSRQCVASTVHCGESLNLSPRRIRKSLTTGMVTSSIFESNDLEQVTTDTD